MQIDAERLARRLQELSAFGKNAAGGIDRSVGCEADRRARAYITDTWRGMGLRVWVDPIANLWAATQPPTQAVAAGGPVVMGSHHDAVPNGGMFDGALGVLMATEVLQTLLENGYAFRHEFRLVSFTAEEPNPFNISTMGSRSITGKLSVEQLAAAHDAAGHNLAEVIRSLGGDIEKLPQSLLKPGDFAAFLECHIEQGRNLFERGLSVATVSRITGIYRECITVVGEANHAGTTMMKDRHDALLGAAELTLALEDIARGTGRRDVVATVGKLEVFPNSANIIPSRVSLMMELRTSDAALRGELLAQFTARLGEIALRRGIAFERTVNLDQREVQMDPAARAAVAKGCAEVQREPVELVSMAGHDSVHMAAIGKTGMLFVQSVNGVSHSAEEYTRSEDVTRAANAMLNAAVELDLTC